MEVHVSFTFKNKEYQGILSEVMGAGSSSIFHLYVDKFYYGNLLFSSFSNSFVFHPSPPLEKQGLEELADYFGACVTEWGG